MKTAVLHIPLLGKVETVGSNSWLQTFW